MSTPPELAEDSNGESPKRHRLVTMLDLRPEQDVFDPALDGPSRSPILGVSFAFLSRLAWCHPTALAKRGWDYRKAMAAGELPPHDAVNLEDWWDIARWVLERRLTARLEADGVQQHEARRRAALGVSQMLAPIRELLR